MNHRLLAAIAGIAVLGTTGIAAYVIASPGDEEEIPQPIATTIPATPDESECGSADIPCGSPTTPFECIFIVVEEDAQCLPHDDPRVSDFEKCSPVRFYSRAVCLPPGANHAFTKPEQISPEAGMDYGPCKDGCASIERGNSIVVWSDQLLEYYVAPEDEADFRAVRALFLPNGATPPHALYPYNCRYIVTNGELDCLSFDNPAVRACTPIDFQDRSACAPAGSDVSFELQQRYDPAIGNTVDKYYGIIKRGNSLIKYHPLDSGPVEFTIAPEDEADFAGIRAVFANREVGQ